VKRSTTHVESDGRAAGIAGSLRSVDVADCGFTLVEMTTSVAMMLVVLSAAWFLLTTSNANLNSIDNGGQASELNRAAMSSFERDLGHAYLPQNDVSPVLMAAPRAVSFMIDQDTSDGHVELVTWCADDANNVLLRVITRSTETTPEPVSVGDFEGGETTTQTVLTGLASRTEMSFPPMFTYGIDATTSYGGELRRIGLVTFHLRNGLPDRNSNVADRTGVFRILALVINGY
jgi:prepilin-type N-terminal cleavage/methylation domain-containing protein